MKKVLLSLIAVMLFAVVNSFAQIEMPAPSPFATFTSKVGLTDVTIEYSRPSAKGRVIYGDLVPFDKMWRTGANASTKISFSDQVIINDQKVPAGKYAVYTIPGKEKWTIILHKNLTYWGTGGGDYKQEEDQLRFTVAPIALTRPVETLTINLANVKSDQADFSLGWEKTRVNFTIKSPVDEKVMASIDRTLNPGGGVYYSAGRYYLESGKDMAKAKEYLDLACKKYDAEGRKAYWAYYRLAEVNQKLGDKKAAKAASEKSTAYAKESDAEEYIKMNAELMKAL